MCLCARYDRYICQCVNVCMESRGVEFCHRGTMLLRVHATTLCWSPRRRSVGRSARQKNTLDPTRAALIPFFFSSRRCLVSFLLCLAEGCNLTLSFFSHSVHAWLLWPFSRWPSSRLYGTQEAAALAATLFPAPKRDKAKYLKRERKNERNGREPAQRQTIGKKKEEKSGPPVGWPFSLALLAPMT